MKNSFIYFKKNNLLTTVLCLHIYISLRSGLKEDSRILIPTFSKLQYVPLSI